MIVVETHCCSYISMSTYFVFVILFACTIFVQLEMILELQEKGFVCCSVQPFNPNNSS